MKTLYQSINPNKTSMLDVGGGHQIYWEESGNPQGEPVVFLHGGPGSGTSPWQRGFFNPERYRIILFDQRGCGKSTPHAHLENNTTDDLVEDIEKLRIFLNIDKLHIFGGSWGSTLALCYANKYGRNVASLTIYGIFLSRPQELFDLYCPNGVASKVFADSYEKYTALLPKKLRDKPIEEYYKLFIGNDEVVRNEALDMWTYWEKRISRLVQSEEDAQKDLSDKKFVLAFALIENHYFRHGSFMDGDALLKTLPEALSHIEKVNIVQGRYDMVCPFATAWELHKAIAHSKIHIIDNAGHTSKEEKSMHCLINIMDNL